MVRSFVRIAWRLVSVGCAVSTGMITMSCKMRRRSSALICSSRSRSTASATVSRTGMPVDCACCARSRRICVRCSSSARLTNWK